MRSPAVIILCAALANMQGCVTENAPRPAPKNSSTGAALPEGPIAVPAKAISTNSRVVMGVAPMGTIPYDGQVLPLTSPDGHFCATQQGQAPTWATLVAAPDAEIPTSSSIAVYDLTTAPPKLIPQAQPQETGLMLGRSADHQGYLVESMRPDGSRWIGKASWLSGQIDWLVRGPDVCAHGVLTVTGDLVFTRRPITGAIAELVVRTPAGVFANRSEGDRPYAMPMTANDPNTIYALALTPSGIELQAIGWKPQASGSSKLGGVLARRVLCANNDAWAAYQIAAPIQGPFPRRGESAQAASEPLVIYNPPMSRMAVFDVRSGSLLPLATNSIAAIRWEMASRAGYLCTTPKGLVFTPEPKPGSAAGDSSAVDVRVLADPYVPRRTIDADRPALLFGPVRTDPGSLEVIGVAAVPEEAPTAEAAK